MEPDQASFVKQLKVSCQNEGAPLCVCSAQPFSDPYTERPVMGGLFAVLGTLNPFLLF